MQRNKLTLTEYQKDLLKNLKLVNYNAGIFMDMGLGKTITALEAIKDLLVQSPDMKILIAAPKRVAEMSWDLEIDRWEDFSNVSYVKVMGTPIQRKKALEKNTNVYITNHDNIAWLSENIKKSYFGTVVVDESTYYKSFSSKRFKAMKKITSGADHVLLLSGTPASNGYENLWSQIYLLDRGERLGDNITAFRRKYFINYGRYYPDWRLNDGADIEIKKAIKDICFYVSSDKIPDMPDNIFNYIPVQFNDKEYKVYKDFKNNAVMQFGNVEVSGLSSASLVNKLLQLSGGAVYADDKRAINFSDVKLERLEELIEEIGENVLIFYNYTHELDRIKKALKKYEPRILKTKKDVEDWNAGRVKILLAHPASAGHGLNLQRGGRHIIWFGPRYDLELFKQANARLARKGNKSTCYVHVLYTKNTIEEQVIEIINKKDITQKELLKFLTLKELNENEKKN